jgi:hypothetical protein
MAFLSALDPPTVSFNLRQRVHAFWAVLGLLPIPLPLNIVGGYENVWIMTSP